MADNMTLDLDKLARGEAIDPAVFLALLGELSARQGLQQAGLVHAVLASTGGRPEVPAGMRMEVTWEELASHAEGALTDESRRLAVERFLNHHFPEALQGRSGGETMGGSAVGTTDIVPDARPPGPTAGDSRQ
jgi:hypothetical protein